MKKPNSGSRLKFGFIALMALAVAGCSSISNVSPDGVTEDPVWPNVESVTLNNKQGTYPNFYNLTQVRSGVTKDQLYYLLGRPHFSEGISAKEWDYLFHFHTPDLGVNNVTTCQFKILFDTESIARSFYWRSVGEGAGCPPGSAKESYTLSADALFEFDKSTLSAITTGRQELDNLAQSLNNAKEVTGITIVGHTDRLGNSGYNMKLSQARAETVGNYLVSQGIPANMIQAYGVGDSQPVVQCDGGGQELINCLAPNRRVVITVDNKQ